METEAWLHFDRSSRNTTANDLFITGKIVSGHREACIPRNGIEVVYVFRIFRYLWLDQPIDIETHYLIPR